MLVILGTLMLTVILETHSYADCCPIVTHIKSALPTACQWTILKYCNQLYYEIRKTSSALMPVLLFTANETYRIQLQDTAS